MNEQKELEFKNFLYAFLTETVVKGMDKTPHDFAHFIKAQVEVIYEKINKHEER